MGALLRVALRGLMVALPALVAVLVLPTLDCLVVAVALAGPITTLRARLAVIRFVGGPAVVLAAARAARSTALAAQVDRVVIGQRLLVARREMSEVQVILGSATRVRAVAVADRMPVRLVTGGRGAFPVVAEVVAARLPMAVHPATVARARAARSGLSSMVLARLYLSSMREL